MYRTSVVHKVIINSLVSTAVVQAGDTERIQSYSAALAVQRESSIFGNFDLKLNDYGLFSQEVRIPLCPPVNIKKTDHANPFIRVGKIDMIGVSTSSLLHIGSVHQLTLQSRVKHIRNFLSNPYQNAEEERDESVC